MQEPKNAQIAYRYDIPNNSSADIRLLIYADSHIAYIPNAPKGEDVSEMFAWELFGEAYKILSKPASLKKALARYQDSDKNIFVYDAKGFWYLRHVFRQSCTYSARLWSVTPSVKNFLKCRSPIDIRVRSETALRKKHTCSAFILEEG